MLDCYPLGRVAWCLGRFCDYTGFSAFEIRSGLPGSDLHWLVPIVQGAIASGAQTATRAEVLKLLKAEAAKATDSVDKKRLQSLIALLEKDDHIPAAPSLLR